MTVQLIGHSEAGRPIFVVHTGPPTAAVRILIVAGQHGDEPRGREAVRRFAHSGSRARPGSPPVALAIVPELNPDGIVQGTRRNAHGIDLNRDHVRLAGSETRALHQFVRTWRPHLVLDVHDFPPRRRHLLARQLVYCQDVFLDVPTHPAAQHAALGLDGWRFLPPVLAGLSAAGWRCARYTRVTNSARVRHSTPDIVDARNGLALRYRLPTVLVEARGRSTRDAPGLEAHVLAGVARTLDLIVQWAQDHRAELIGLIGLIGPIGPIGDPPGRAVDDSVPVRTRYRPAAGPCRLEFADARSGRIRTVDAPGRYTPELDGAGVVTLPRAYAVPRVQPGVLEVLWRHGFDLVRPAPDRLERVERYRVEELTPSRRPNRSPHELRLSVRIEHGPLHDQLLVPVTAEGGAALAVLLEPASKHGLARFRELDLCLTPRSDYPVARVVPENA